MAGKSEERLFLGLDTSAYTTAMALVDGAERLVWEKRLLLPVRRGNRGLRQSEAVFHHLRHLPRLWEEGARVPGGRPLGGVAASTRPRPVEGSYMPVFKVGEAFGEFVAHTLGLFFLPTSHQEGHVTAGLWSAGLAAGRHLVLHLSGGTTELLSAEEVRPGEPAIERLGGTADLNAGQFIDRIGVAMGLPFPAGPALEALARKGRSGALRLPVAVRGTEVSFSGPESQARRLLAAGCSREDLARAVEVCVADTLVQAVNNVAGLDVFTSVLVVGGIAANSFIKGYLSERITALPLYFADPAFAGDNAVGVALQAARRQRGAKG